MAVPLDPLGNTVLSLQIVILFLLIIGLPFVKGRDSKKIARADIRAHLIHKLLNKLPAPDVHAELSARCPRKYKTER
jgi:hypothetical protein